MTNEKSFLITVRYDKNIRMDGVIQRAIDAYPIYPVEGNVDVRCAGVQEVTPSMASALNLVSTLREEMSSIAARECAED